MARCIEWFNWLSGTVHAVAFAGLWRPERFVSEEQHFEAIRHHAHDNIMEAFHLIENALQAGNWALVEHGYSVIDLFLFVFYRWGNRIGLDMHPTYPAWAEHTERLLERAAVRRALELEGVTPYGR